MPFLARKLEVPWRSLHGSAWEQFVAEVFRRRGYWVKAAPDDVHDGIDLIASYDDEKLGIHCRGGVEAVNSEAVQLAIAGQAVHNCSRAVVVTNSIFTAEATKLASASNCWLVDAGEFAELAGDHQNVVTSRRPSLFARMCMGLWALLVRLFGMTLALIVLVLGVAAIGLVVFFVVRELRLPTPSHEPVEVPQLRPADATAESPQVDSPVSASPQTSVSDPGPVAPQPPMEAPRYEVDRPTEEAARLWRSADGRFSQEAVYLGFDAGKVKLRRTDTGEVIEVELDELSDLDKKIVAARLQSARSEVIQRRRAERAAAEEAEEN